MTVPKFYYISTYIEAPTPVHIRSPKGVRSVLSTSIGRFCPTLTPRRNRGLKKDTLLGRERELVEFPLSIAIIFPLRREKIR